MTDNPALMKALSQKIQWKGRLTGKRYGRGTNWFR